jgi:hypothetical protein
MKEDLLADNKIKKRFGLNLFIETNENESGRFNNRAKSPIL